MARVLITGAAGFVGHHLVKEFCDRGDEVIALDSLTYAGDLNRVDPRARFVLHDLSHHLFDDDHLIPEIDDLGVDYIIHNGAESHVARSFSDPGTFVRSNVIGTLNILEAARILQPKKFVYTSTDEVFGSRTEPAQTGDRLQPANPYSATKAGGEYLVNSYRRSFNIPAVITRTTNLFGPGQDREKFVPLAIGKIFYWEPVPIHTTGKKIGSRRWLHVSGQVNAVVYACTEAQPGEVIHVGSSVVLDNLEIAIKIAGILGLAFDPVMVSPVDRPVYDESYWIEGTREWMNPGEFNYLLEQTVLSYVKGWPCDPVKKALR